MLKRKLDKDEFSLLFQCYLVCHREGFLEDNTRPFDLPEKRLFSLVKEEANDAIFFLSVDKEDKKIKREIFKNNYLLVDAAVQDGDIKAVRQYCKKAFLEGYAFFYGNALFEFFEEEVLPVKVMMAEGKVGEFIESPWSKLWYESRVQGALEKLLRNGGIKV